MAYTFPVNSALHTATTPVTGVPLTLAAWARVRSISASGPQTILQLALSSQSTLNSYRMVIPASQRAIRATITLNGSTTGGAADSPANSVPLNTWFHVAAVFPSLASRSPYVNGVIGATNTGVATAPSVANIHIGGTTLAGVVQSTFDGNICEAGIWNVALTADEIAALAKGVTCDQIRPQSLVFYAPLIRDLVDVRGGLTITNTNNATATEHPRVYA
jgi:hypothetical protein